MIKVQVQGGTNNVKRCVFCSNWEGNEIPEYIGNNRFSYNQNAMGVCRAQHDLKKRAHDTCHTSKMDIWPRYLEKRR